MNNNIRRWNIIGTIFIIVSGTILHFVYQWSGNNPVVGIFAPVNESTWEHLKLLFWPGFIFSILEYIFAGKKYNNYISAKAVTFYSGMFLIISLFYTYTGVFGQNYLIVDIAIFIVSVIISQYLGYKVITRHKNLNPTVNIISLLAILLLIFAFIYFTFNPPQIPLFEDPTKSNSGK